MDASYAYYGILPCAGGILNSMRKLRETERSHQIRLAPRIEEKISSSTDHVENLCNGECDAAAEVERLRELTVEQQEVIEVLRQAVKEKERKLDQISNKKRKEEFYKQWLELEPVVEVEDEDEHEHEEGDSALSSAPSSLSPQPGGCGQWQHTGVTREAYETVLLEVEELQTRLVEEQRELAHAKTQVRDLEKALLQETRGSQNSRRALSDKLREIEEREASLVAEISELREQNELLEFRVLELEETPCLRDTPDPADSGIVSPEPIHLYKDQLHINKQRDRAVATVIPYNTYNNSISPIPQKPPLSLQESGIFEEEDEVEVELASCGTQTETPAGDLLQEVQRLHELRARIQERGVKVPNNIVDSKFYSVSDVTDVIEQGQVNSYQERIRELEERLQAYGDDENKRMKEKQLSKQREEDLLDENYRLTERIYYFENLIRNSKNSRDISSSPEDIGNSSLDPGSDGNTEKEEMSTDIAEESEDTVSSYRTTLDHNEDISGDELSCVKNIADDSNFDHFGANEGGDFCKECGKMETEIIERLDELVKVEVLTRQRIVDLERREATYMKTLKKADETWVQTERCYSMRLEELEAKLALELGENEKLSRRTNELENKLRELKSCALCQGDVTTRHKEPEKCDYSGVDEVDPRPEIPGNKDPGISIPMEVDQTSDEVDGDVVMLDMRSSPSISSKDQENGKRFVTKVSKILMPEMVAELAEEAKEEDLMIEERDKGPEVTEVQMAMGSLAKAEEVTEEDNERDSGPVAEPVVTINETEPEKKDKSAGATWWDQVTYRNGTSVSSLLIDEKNNKKTTN